MKKLSRFLAVVIAVLAPSVGLGADRRDFVTTDARMVVCINVSALMSSPLAKVEGNPVRRLADSLDASAKYFDLNSTSAIEQLWIVVGESYPRGTLIVAQGKFDPDRVRRQFQELARTRKSGVRLSWENDYALLSVEVPHSTQPIPGVPGNALIANSGPEFILAAFEKETLLPALTRAAIAPTNNAPVPMLEKLDANAAISWVALVPPSLAAPKAAFAGGDQVFGTIELTHGFVAKSTITTTKGADEAQAMAGRLSEAVKQTLQLLPTLSQSSMDPKLVSWLSAALKTARISVDDNRVNMVIDVGLGDQKPAR